MTGGVFAIRPEPGLTETIAAGRAVGLGVDGEAAFAIEPVAWQPVSEEALDGLLIGSANAIRHAGEGLAGLLEKPVYAVGERTAEAARGAGLTVASTGEGGLQALVAALKPPLRLLRLAGATHVDLAPPQGIELITRVTYRSVPRPLSADFARRLAEGGIVLLHSGEAARHFAAECERLALPRDRLSLVVLAPRILEGVGGGWSWTAAAREPREGALLALARDMCLSGAGRRTDEDG